jgi:hypothetical protein
MKQIFLNLFFLLLSGLPLMSQPQVVMHRNEGNVSGRFIYINTDGYFDNDGEVQKLLEYRTLKLIIGADYGLSDKVNIFFRFPALITSSADFIFAEAGKQTKSYSASGDADLGARYIFFHDRPYYVAAEGSFSLPSGKDNNIYGLNTGYGSFTETAAVRAGYKMSNGFYGAVYGGYINRDQGFTDAVLAGGRAGYHWKNITASIRCDAMDPRENGDDHKRGGLPGLYSNNSGFIYIGPEVNYILGEHWGLLASALIPVKGQFIQSAPVFEAGVFYRWGFEGTEVPVDEPAK